ARPLTVAGSGLVGVGATPDAYGAITARGRLDARTSLTLGLDSRRLNAGRDVFGRSTDPLEEAQYPILGDASQQQTRTASHNWVSARLERGFDWAAYGDLSTTDFASGLSLAQYRRAVTGLAAHVTTGAVTWSGFGSLTSQSLRQLQIRGAGSSGPYQLAADMLPGTEYLRVETRDLQNPERAVTTQGLSRFVDYEIDYTSGVVLFKQPIPAADAYGNPVFIVATFEAGAGGEQRRVAGARAPRNLRPPAGGLQPVRRGPERRRRLYAGRPRVHEPLQRGAPARPDRGKPERRTQGGRDRAAGGALPSGLRAAGHRPSAHACRYRRDRRLGF